MDGEQNGFDQQRNPVAGGSGEENLSASFLPYDDSRLWLQMPEAEGKKSGRRKRERAQKAPKAPKPPKEKRRKRERERPAAESPGATRPEPRRPTSSKVRRPTPKWVARTGVVVAALILPVTALALVRITAAGTPDVIGPDGTPSISPSAVVLPISGLQATKVSFKKVTIEWQAPAAGATFTYTVYRDGVKYGTSDAPSFTDDGVEPQRYYYYAITATGSDGSLASSVQLLVAVPSETGALPTAPPPPPPAPPVIQPTLSPSPSPSPSPRPSFIRGGGGGGGGVTTTTAPPPPPTTSTTTAPPPPPTTSTTTAPPPPPTTSTTTAPPPPPTTTAPPPS